jgi:hypothetical protein
MVNPPQRFAFDGLAKLDPARERRLSHFLGAPIDSRDLEPFPPPLVITGPGGAAASSKQALERDWDRRFARVYQALQVPVRPRAHSVAAPAGPSLVERQRTALPDPLNCRNVEEIADRRLAAVQGPAQQPSRLPRLRRLPREIAGDRARKSRHRH